MKEDEIGKHVVDVAVRIHSDLGPGLLKSVYERIFVYELGRRALRVGRQVAVRLTYAEAVMKDGIVRIVNRLT